MTDTDLLLDPKLGKRLYAPVDLTNAGRMIAGLSRTDISIDSIDDVYLIRPARFDRPVRTLAMQLAHYRQWEEEKKAK